MIEMMERKRKYGKKKGKKRKKKKEERNVLHTTAIYVQITRQSRKLFTFNINVIEKKKKFNAVDFHYNTIYSDKQNYFAVQRHCMNFVSEMKTVHGNNVIIKIVLYQVTKTMKYQEHLNFRALLYKTFIL